MEDRNGKEWYGKSKVMEMEKGAVSKLVIEDNTIYEIDLQCQFRKKNNSDACKWCNEKRECN